MQTSAHPSPLRTIAERVAALNPDAGQIGAGMLAQLVTEARRALDDEGTGGSGAAIFAHPADLAAAAAPSVLLIGPQGCGKSTHAQAFARAFGCTHVIDGESLNGLDVDDPAAIPRKGALIIGSERAEDCPRADLVIEARTKAGFDKAVALLPQRGTSWPRAAVFIGTTNEADMAPQTHKRYAFAATLAQLAAAFTEWDRRYREEPERFMSEAQRLLKETPETYGEAAAPYLMAILQEQVKHAECKFEARTEDGGAMRICTECAYSGQAGGWLGAPENEPECRHELATLDRSMTTGERSYQLALIMRASNGACGPDGRLWKPARPFAAICRHCSHYEGSDRDGDRCAHPALRQSPPDLVTGRQVLAHCRAARATDGGCGVEGRLFEARIVEGTATRKEAEQRLGCRHVVSERAPYASHSSWARRCESLSILSRSDSIADSSMTACSGCARSPNSCRTSSHAPCSVSATDCIAAPMNGGEPSVGL